MKAHIRELVKGGLIAGFISAAIAFLLNYYLIPFPETVVDNAVGHGIGGFIAGFISACMGTACYIWQHHSKHVFSSQ